MAADAGGNGHRGEGIRPVSTPNTKLVYEICNAAKYEKSACRAHPTTQVDEERFCIGEQCNKQVVKLDAEAEAKLLEEFPEPMILSPDQ